MALNKLARLFIVCCCTLLLPASALAQNGSHYTTTSPTVGISDGTADCLLAGHQCWVSISTAPILSQISVGVDGSVYGLDASGNIWFLPLNSHTWQSTSLSPMAQLSVVNSTNIYALQTDSAFCGPPEMRIYQYTGGTDFAKVSYCAVNIAAAQDGSLYRIRSSGNVTHLANGSWISDPSAGGNGTPTKIVAGSASNVWLITSTGVIKMLNSSGSFVVVPGTATDITTAGDVANGEQLTTFIVGAMANSNNVYTYSYAQGQWNELIGVLDKISAGGTSSGIGPSFFTMGIRLSSNTVFHLNNAKTSVSSSTTGYYDCSVFPNGCPSGSTHTATINIHFSSGGHPGSGSSVGAPAQNLNALATAYTEDCDPIFGNPSDPECQSTAAGAVACSVMGAIFAENLAGPNDIPLNQNYGHCTSNSPSPGYASLAVQWQNVSKGCFVGYPPPMWRDLAFHVRRKATRSPHVRKTPQREKGFVHGNKFGMTRRVAMPLALSGTRQLTRLWAKEARFNTGYMAHRRSRLRLRN